MADKYVIRVTAGSSYDTSTHTEVPVNTPAPVTIGNKFLDAELNVRVKNYRGLPRGSPASSPYFEAEPHAYNNDQYSIAFRFTLKRPSLPAVEADSSENNGGEEGVAAAGISAADLQWGNDFDHAIRDRLPPGFGTAMNIVKWWIDPGLEGDPYADSPYLYGPALSSFNAVHVGHGELDDGRGGLWLEEGGDEAGMVSRKAIGAPDDAKARMKWALRDDSKKSWMWEYGRTYGVDFFNAYVDFSDFALRLPGYSLPIMKYWDGQGLRYVLRNRATSDVYLVVVFTLYRTEDVNEDGTLKPAALQQRPLKGKAGVPGGHVEDATVESPDEDEAFDEAKALQEAKRKLSGVDTETSADDVD